MSEVLNPAAGLDVAAGELAVFRREAPPRRLRVRHASNNTSGTMSSFNGSSLRYGYKRQQHDRDEDSARC